MWATNKLLSRWSFCNLSAIILGCVSCALQMGGGGHLVPVGGERLSGPAEGKVWPRPAHRHSARRPGQPEGGTLLPQEKSRGGEIPATGTVETCDVVDGCLLVSIAALHASKFGLISNVERVARQSSSLGASKKTKFLCTWGMSPETTVQLLRALWLTYDHAITGDTPFSV